ncbi:hypothetical protein SAMN06264364_11683 [Quadrisphaera granulorum]|uniref:Uncharacterized protein n=1 Tax=Quadrisphaera granulorum TaxID=317664 RepID=A0A316AS61_9ACTN|nr:hypothetical protein BXY45_11683 [Quadrisphaera granulorum]SZE97329.1 hypothetical protein SAMN06264364_11683 [Quadrisphaera granulorum]
MRAVRSLTSTAFTLFVLAAIVVVLFAYALPQVSVPGVDTTGLEARSQELVHQVVSVVTGAVSGAWNGALEGARSAG